jgi:hypothetical protein
VENDRWGKSHLSDRRAADAPSQKALLQKCQALEKRAKFWRDLAGRYKAIIYGPSRKRTTDDPR